jgi:hypothetical protein
MYFLFYYLSFVSDMQFIDRAAAVLPSSTLRRGKRNGILFQKGVLRTNCIDCLDRTNGGQFAVAMRFLLISLQVLGISNPNLTALDLSKDPLLLSLMEMYGEMGDKIALQYGGSEAHKKVFAGKTVQQPNSSKQSELLTSIKRYYSNAFTDMVKQDAMNLFLGCFIPNESIVPLWDLESDYYLHNLDLHPRSPRVYHVLFNDIVKDSDLLRETSLKMKLESAMKKAFNEYHRIKEANNNNNNFSFSNMNNNSNNNSENQEDSKQNSSLIPLDGASSTHSPMNLSESTKLGLKIDAAKVMIRYYIRNLAQQQQAQQNTPSSSPVPPTTPGGGASLGLSPMNKLKSKGILNSTIRALARLERRKLMRMMASSKISASSQGWWKEPLDDYYKALEFQTPAQLRASTSSPQQFIEGNGGDEAQNDVTENKYYERFHKPYQLTEFDELLNHEFFKAVDAVNVDDVEINKKKSLKLTTDFDKDGDLLDLTAQTTIVQGGGVGGGQEKDRKLSNAGIAAPSAVPPAGVGAAAAAGGDGSVLPYGLSSLFSFYPTLANTMVEDQPPVSSGGTAGQMVSYNAGNQPLPGMVTPSKQAQPPYNYYDPNMSAGSTSINIDGTLPSYYDGMMMGGDDMNNRYTPGGHHQQQNQQQGQAGGGFGFTKYVREIGIKAKNIVGGFLKKEGENMITPNRSNNRIRTHSDDLMIGNKRNSEISLLNHSIPRASQSLYRRYRDAYENYLTLAVTDGVKYVEEEYNSLLKEMRIKVDDVKGMENLAAEGYISHEINRGVFQGLSQNSSAILAYGFLFTTIANVEQELEYFGNYVDHKASISRSMGYQIRSSHEKENGPEMQALTNMRKTSMIMSNEVQERIIKSILRSKIAMGLEMELKKMINNYIFIQYQNAKELSFDRLSRRVSPYTPERIILEYSSQFDFDYLGSDLTSVNYIASDSPGYSSFRDLMHLNAKIQGHYQSYAQKKSKLLKKMDKKVTIEEEGGPKDDNESGLSILQPNKSTESLNSINNDQQPDRERSSTHSSASPRTMANVTAGKGTGSNPDFSTISHQLGITVEGLLEDLKTDYSLTSYGAFGYPNYPYGQENTFNENNYNHMFSENGEYNYDNGGSKKGGKDTSRRDDSGNGNGGNGNGNGLSSKDSHLHLYDYEYNGFIHLAPDLYSKLTNPHLQLNEIGVIRFQEALLSK